MVPTLCPVPCDWRREEAATNLLAAPAAWSLMRRSAKVGRALPREAQTNTRDTVKHNKSETFSRPVRKKRTLGAQAISTRRSPLPRHFNVAPEIVRDADENVRFFRTGDGPPLRFHQH